MPIVRAWMQLAVIAIAFVAAVAPIDTETIERRFSTGIYPRVQGWLTPLSNAVPFAVFDVLTVGAVVAVAIVLVRGVRRARRERRRRLILQAVASIATAAAVAYLVFLGFWGFNYRRLPMAARLEIAHAPPDAAAVLALGREAARQMNALHTEAHRIGWREELRADPALVNAFAFIQRHLSDAPVPAVPGRLKQTIYGPYFRWTSVDGMVNPFALEVLANPDLLPYERSFVAAHEWAHLAGYAHEAEANFVAWLTCVRADAPAQYSAWLNLYWQIYGEVSPGERSGLREALGEGPRRDVDAIVDRVRRGQLPMLRNASWRVYDHYLRANRVPEGIRSYGEVVTLLLRAQFDDGWIPVRRGSASSR
jgi:hypothetical protein